MLFFSSSDVEASYESVLFVYFLQLMTCRGFFVSNPSVYLTVCLIIHTLRQKNCPSTTRNHEMLETWDECQKTFLESISSTFYRQLLCRYIYADLTGALCRAGPANYLRPRATLCLNTCLAGQISVKKRKVKLKFCPSRAGCGTRSVCCSYEVCRM